jgi:uncharacterized repeat protein (TIGR03803 family)
MQRNPFWAAASKALAAAAVTLSIVLALAPGTWAASKYKPLYKFTGGADGSQPYTGLIFDQAGNLYGTTEFGGAYGLGTVFELTPNGDGTWKEHVLYSFQGTPDGYSPDSHLTFDAAGNLYGMTWNGGIYGAYMGTVFQLSPNGDGSWKETVIHSFGGGDGIEVHGGVIFDSAGNLYGTAKLGGAYGWGTAFQLTPNGDGTWTENVIYSFRGGDDKIDAVYPITGLVFDQAGSLYGASTDGGVYNDGTVFEISPNGQETWTEKVLYSFGLSGNHSDGWQPAAGLIFDPAGNLFGTTVWGNDNGYYNGVVFRLSPNGDGSWKESVIHSFIGADGAEPWADLMMDQAGNLYGTTFQGGAHKRGVVFRLRPKRDGGWGYKVLHAFNDQPGAYSRSSLVIDPLGNLYGTTYGHPKNTFGSVFEITP